MELWAGFECTRNRVGDIFRDQLDPADRELRTQVLGMLGAAGVSAFRYRIAWDDDETPPDVIDRDMATLKECSIRPIIGLLHHGSGPRHVDLLSPDLAPGLAAHARRVAERFPEVEAWTPVNEPLTTARFAALYGHWYPHHRSEHDFWLALLNQIDATRLAMREIRQVNPAARLVQTEDLGRTYATAALADQAAFDNQRRWMTWDLLDGRVRPGHPLFNRLRQFGFGDRLHAIADDPCPADVIGVNHYATSNRFLDHRTALYPQDRLGGNGRRSYADVEAVRVLACPQPPIARALEEACDRYGRETALTECHIGCSREEQMRWVAEAWSEAERLNGSGAQITALTAWALTGTRHWSRLATGDCDDFECGAFDVRGGTVRPTALFDLLAALVRGKDLPEAAKGAGWWQRPGRLSHHPAAVAGQLQPVRVEPPGRPLLIAGATGSLGQALQRSAHARGLFTVSTARTDMAVDNPASIESALDRYNPWAVINATGWVRVDDAEAAVGGCMRTNIDGALNLARASAGRGLTHVHFSSDLAFDGESENAYCENDDVAPLSVYGRSKAEADRALAEIPGALIIRTAAFFSPHDCYNFAHALHSMLARGGEFAASPEHHVSPTYVPHLADCVLDLTIDRATGLWHITNGEELSWFDFATRLATACNLGTEGLREADAKALGWQARRPRRSGLRSVHGQRLPSLDIAIHAFARATAGRV